MPAITLSSRRIAVFEDNERKRERLCGFVKMCHGVAVPVTGHAPKINALPDFFSAEKIELLVCDHRLFEHGDYAPYFGAQAVAESYRTQLFPADAGQIEDRRDRCGRCAGNASGLNTPQPQRRPGAFFWCIVAEHEQLGCQRLHLRDDTFPQPLRIGPQHGARGDLVAGGIGLRGRPQGGRHTLSEGFCHIYRFTFNSTMQ